MKVLRFDFVGIGKLKNKLDELNQWKAAHESAIFIFEVFAPNTDRARIELWEEIIEQEMPDAFFLGCSSKGNIVDEENSNAIATVICFIYETPNALARIYHFDFATETLAETVDQLKKIIKQNLWVKAVWSFISSHGHVLSPFCKALQDVRPSIQFFGAGASKANSKKDDIYVFSKDRGFTQNGGVFLLIGGDSLDVTSERMTTENLMQLTQKFTAFQPDFIRVFANTARNDIPFQNLAHTSFFCSDNVFCGLKCNDNELEKLEFAVAVREKG